MTKSGQPIEMQIGSVLPTGTMFIGQHQVKDEKAGFSLDLPGKVYRCGEAVVQTVTPRARIVVPGAKPVRAARISAEVTDHVSKAKAIESLVQAIDCAAPLSFAVRLTLEHNVGEVLDAAAKAGVGGGCGCSGAEAAFPGAISVGLAPGAQGKLRWSDPVAAMIYAAADGALIYGGSDEDCTIAARDNCSETWELFNGTTCTGLQCRWPEDCKCDTERNGDPITSCSGWVRCNCNP